MIFLKTVLTEKVIHPEFRTGANPSQLAAREKAMWSGEVTGAVGIEEGFISGFFAIAILSFS